jgi:hypothetical protein
MVAATPPSHPEYASLVKANELLGQAVATINQRKREAEQQQYMRDLAQNIVGGKHVSYLLFVIA